MRLKFHAFSLIFQAVIRAIGRAVLRHFSPDFAGFLDLTARDLRSKMASMRKENSGRWRAQVRRKGRTLSATFLRHQAARDWAIEREREIDRGEPPKNRRIADVRTFGDLVDLHIAPRERRGSEPAAATAAPCAPRNNHAYRATLCRTIAEFDPQGRLRLEVHDRALLEGALKPEVMLL